MKKFRFITKKFYLIMVLVLSLSLSACVQSENAKTSKNNSQELDNSKKNPEKEDSNGQSSNNTESEKSIELKEILEKSLKDSEAPDSYTEKLDKSNFEQFSFIPWRDGIEAILSESNININAHSLVLIKTTKDNSEEIAKSISEKANMSKWICVSAESGKVLYAKDYVLMIMSFKDTTNKISNNFTEIFGKDNTKYFEIKNKQ